MEKASAAGVALSSEVECGWLGRVRRLADRRFSIEVQSSAVYGMEGSLEVWVAGLVHAEEPGDVELVVVNEHGNMRFLRPFYSFDGVTWVRVPRANFDSSSPTRFVFTVPTQGAGRPTHFATWVPYPLSRHTGLLEQLRDARDVDVVEIGRSVEGRPIHAVMLGPLGSPRIAVSAGMHGAETTGMHAAAGALRYLISAAGHDLREAARYAFIPIVNVDAQATGLDRRNAAGVNLWLDAAAPDQPEVRALTSFLQEFAPDAYLDYHSWHWGGDGCYMPGWVVVGDTLYGRILALRASVERHFAMTAQIFTADDDSCWTARVARLLRTPTLTVETSLGVGTDGAWKSLERVEQDGVAALRGAVEYVATATVRNEAPTASP